MASPLFCHCLLEDIGLEALLGVHLLQTPVFVLQLLQARHHRCIHAAVLGPPLIERGAAHAVLAAQLRHGRASLGLLEDRQDLAVAVTGLFHVEPPRLRVRENSTSGRCYYAGGLPLHSQVRKTIRNKGHFPSDEAAIKLIYLSLRQIQAKWKRPPREWHAAKAQLAIQFAERFTLSD